MRRDLVAMLAACPWLCARRRERIYARLSWVRRERGTTGRRGLEHWEHCSNKAKGCRISPRGLV